jgi:hypothetical protein
MGDREIDDILSTLLGRNAFNNSMKVSPDFGKLVKTVNYLTTQLKITGRWCDDEGKEHIKSVIETVKNILDEKQ